MPENQGTSPRAERCETCKFWERIPKDPEGRGECNRYAPEPVHATRAVTETMVSPRTLPSRWCGEWGKI